VLSSGTRLGAYEVLALIGSGGMGEVYRARDPKLNREVALKILPAEFTLVPDRLARFRREAQVLASLNHPNIAAIYGFEETDGAPALVLELVEGPTLADRVSQGAIPLDDALGIAKQIAEALEAAHERGIVHRDLKPANVKVRSDGTVKVLDFGLAKAMEPAVSSARNLSQSPTITTPAMTQLGVILGTAAYMSPEQAKGKPADKRSDIWAFGCVLYEALTRKRAFEGDDVSETLASILRAEPDWRALPSSTPTRIRTLLQRCLQKDLRKRLPHIGVARLEIDEPSDDLDETRRSGRAVPPSAPGLLTRWLPAIIAAVLAVAATALVAWRIGADAVSPQVTRFSIRLADGQRFSSTARGSIALSPDGTMLAFLASDGLFVRPMADPEPKRIASGEAWGPLTSNLVFSPDGRSLLFYAPADSTLKRISIGGGATVTLARLDGPPHGVSWSNSGIAWGMGNRGVFRVSEEGGTPEQIVSVNADEQAYGPQLLRNDQQVLFTLASGAGVDRWDHASIVVQSRNTGERKTVVEGGSDARVLPSGHLVYAVAGVLMTVPFDVDRLALTGSPIPAVEGILRPAGASTGLANFSYSNTGSLIYIPGPAATSFGQLRLAVFDRAGSVAPLKIQTGPYEFPRVSPDGTRAAVGASDTKEAVIWICDLTGGTSRRRLTFEGRNRFPLWSADGQHVAFQSDRDGDLGIFWQRADGTSPNAERLTRPGQNEAHVPQAWSPDGDRLLFSIIKQQDVSLSVLSLRDKTITPYGDVHSQLPTAATLSPDGRWVAYQSGSAGNNAIYVQPFPRGGEKHLISVGNAHHPRWSQDGRQLFFVPARSQPAIVNVTTDPTFVYSDPVAFGGQKWLEAGPVTERTYDLMPDGEHVLGFVDPSSQVENQQIQVVLNWFEELRQRAPVKQ
jgi:eukaryotic-like serine/threonine-protein kinase